MQVISGFWRKLKTSAVEFDSTVPKPFFTFLESYGHVAIECVTTHVFLINL